MPGLITSLSNYFFPPNEITQCFTIRNFEDLCKPNDKNYQKSIKSYISECLEEKNLTLTYKDQKFLYIAFKLLDYLRTKFDLYFLNLEIENNSQGKPTIPLQIKLSFKAEMVWDKNIPTFFPLDTEKERRRHEEYINKFNHGSKVNSKSLDALDELKMIFPNAEVHEDTPEYRGTIDTCEHYIIFKYSDLKHVIYSLEVPQELPEEKMQSIALL